MPVISIIGKPNVGKSTLFNRMTGTKDAVVHETPNLTRDRHYGLFEWRDREFQLVDTGGIEKGSDAPFIKLIEEQVDIAINESDCVIFMVDYKSIVSEDDFYIAEKLRKVREKVILTVNKCDNFEDDFDSDIYRLGFDTILRISAEHRLNIDSLKDEIFKLSGVSSHTGINGVRLAVVGKPNVGKSSFINALVKSNRMIVSDIPGTTRDAVDTLLKFNKRNLILVDTAGIRRSSRIDSPTEYYTVLRSRLAMRRADIIFVMMDISEGITSQDKHILDDAQKTMKPVVAVFNKTDLIPVEEREAILKDARRKLHFAEYLPVINSSVKNYKNVVKILEKGVELYDSLPKKFQKAKLNELLFEIVSRTKHPIVSGRRPRFYALIQKSDNPIRFQIEVSNIKNLDNSYKRYIINTLRERLEIIELPFDVTFKEKRK